MAYKDKEKQNAWTKNYLRWLRAKRKSLHLCIRCGESDDRTAIEHKVYCAKCAEKIHTQYLKSKEKEKKNND